MPTRVKLFDKGKKKLKVPYASADSKAEDCDSKFDERVREVCRQHALNQTIESRLEEPTSLKGSRRRPRRPRDAVELDFLIAEDLERRRCGQR